MNHFDAESWSDYVRGIAPEAQAVFMKSHLEEGCSSCSGHVTAFQAVRRMVANERALGLEPGIVRSVKAAFRQRRVLVEAAGPVRRLQLVFDSALAPATPGVRAGRGPSRQLVFMSEELSLELRVVPGAAGEGGTRLVGEIVESELGHLAEVPVVLLAGGDVVAEAVTGELGEFDLPAARDQALRLRFELEEAFELEIPATR